MLTSAEKVLLGFSVLVTFILFFGFLAQYIKGDSVNFFWIQTPFVIACGFIAIGRLLRIE